MNAISSNQGTIPLHCGQRETGNYFKSGQDPRELLGANKESFILQMVISVSALLTSTYVYVLLLAIHTICIATS